MKKLGRFLGRISIGALVIAIVLGAGGMYYFKSYLPDKVAPRSFPQIEGEIKVEGLDGEVDIYRDQMGIPHIYATSVHDLFFAQGYVHAQDRFWQMDFWRHIGSARLSEMFGKSQVDTDAFLRTLGWSHIAETEWENLSTETKTILNSYSEGVNAYLNDHTGDALSLEYGIVKLLTPEYQIEEWTPLHSLTWAKAMAWDLRGNMGEEIERAILLKTLTPDQVNELFPPYPDDHPVIVKKLANGITPNSSKSDAGFIDIPTELLSRLQHNASLLDPVLGPASRGVGSNSWVVSGELTTTGMPMFSNDPHLGSQMPSIWYQVSLHCKPKSDECPYEVGGFSFAGVPGIIIGHNDKIAWGMTNTGPDVMDLFIERVNPENPDQYEVNGQWVDFETREETIRIAGGDPATITVRLTRHGPVISDTYGPVRDNFPPDAEATPFKDKAGIDLPEQYVIALRWTALEPSPVFDSIWRINRAENWDQFREATRSFNVPAQNLLYADTNGNIGYQQPGWIPIRANGDGRLPVPGWTDEFEWTGYIPFEELPYTFNPPEGYIVTANNQTHPRDYPFLIATDFDYGYRAARIVDMIEKAPGKIDIPYIQQMQGDTLDSSAMFLLPLLVEMNERFTGPNQAIAFDMLKNWEYHASVDSKPAVVYEWFLWHLLQNTFSDDLSEDYWPEGGDRWFEVMRNIVDQPDSFWWDDQSSSGKVETRADIFRQSFAEAVQSMLDEYGKDPAKWPSWGKVHTVTFRNGTLGESGIGLIENLFNRGPFESGGGKSIVNATGWDVGVSFEIDWLPSMRMIVDMGNLNNSVAVHTTGESGHAYHKHYDDMAPLWASMQYYRMWWEQDSVIEEAEGHLKLLP
jgi:penicillin amidase